MGVLDFGGSTGNGGGNFWNFSNKQKDLYTLAITGDLVKIKRVARREYGTGNIERWPDGKAKLDIQFVIRTDEYGDQIWQFKPGSGKRPSKPVEGILAAMRAAGLASTDLNDLGGFNMTISTKEPPAGFAYGAGCPRPFEVKINGLGSNKYEGFEDYVEPVDQAQQDAQRLQAAQQRSYQQQYQAQPVYNNDSIPF